MDLTCIIFHKLLRNVIGIKTSMAMFRGESKKKGKGNLDAKRSVLEVRKSQTKRKPKPKTQDGVTLDVNSEGKATLKRKILKQKEKSRKPNC